MNKQPISRILKINPQLKKLMASGQFLTGYTDGGASGVLISIFLRHSPWSANCIQATAHGAIPAGEVLVTSPESKWSLSMNWQAYSLVT